MKHVHAEVIKAWADDSSAVIQFRYQGGPWYECDGIPDWDKCNEYRVKPTPPAKVYPVTGMGERDFAEALGISHEPSMAACTKLANAALRHAIDAGQVITPNEHQAALDQLGQNLCGIEINRRNTARDLAIAEAVLASCNAARFTIPGWDGIDLPTIIANVKD